MVVLLPFKNLTVLAKANMNRAERHLSGSGMLRSFGDLVHISSQGRLWYVDLVWECVHGVLDANQNATDEATISF